MTQVFIQKCKLRTYTIPPESHLWVGEIKDEACNINILLVWTMRMKPLQRYELRNTCQQHACIYRCSAHRLLFSIDAKLILPTLKGIKYRNQTQPKVNTCIKLRQKHVPKLNQHSFDHLYRHLKQSKTSILLVFSNSVWILYRPNCLCFLTNKINIM